jgi:hypothetical protein
MSWNCDGVASRPSSTNMMICASQLAPSWKLRSAGADLICRLPA